MSRLGRKPLCLYNDAIFLPHIKYKSLWSSKRLDYDFLHIWWQNPNESPRTFSQGTQYDLFMATGGVKNF